MTSRPPAKRRASTRALMWTKLHRGTWFSPFLRMQKPEVRVLYGDLSASCGADGSMPSDDAGLASAFGIDPDMLSTMLSILLSIGVVGRMHNGRLVVLDVARDREYADSRRNGGKARQRAANATDAQHDAGHDAQHIDAASSFSGSGQNQRGSDSSDSGSLNPETQAQGTPKVKKKTAPRAPPTGPNADVIRAWEAEFKRVRGVEYAFCGAKDGESVKALLGFAHGDVAKVLERMPVFFRDQFRREKASLAMFRAKWNECVPPKAVPAQTTFVDSAQEPENAAFIAQLRANAARQEAEKAAKRNGHAVGGAA